jgi:hypothetical protein
METPMTAGRLDERRDEEAEDTGERRTLLKESKAREIISNG